MELVKRRRLLGLAAVAAVVALSTGGLLVHRIVAQEKPAPAAPAQQKKRDIGAELVTALKAAPGCLGVDVGTMKSGKSSIFAWFEDKKAVVDWYYSDAHQGFMGSMAAGVAADPKGEETQYEPHEPLEFVKDGTGPILCVATITPSDRPMIPGFPGPIRQISIELYQPLPGGVSINGTLAPDSMKLEHHERIGAFPTPAPAGPAAPLKKG